MQCNWQPLARLAFRGFARPWPPFRTIHTSLKTPPTPWPTVSNSIPSPSSFRLLTQRHLSSAVQLSHPSKTTIPPTPEILNIHTNRTKDLDSTEPTFTPAAVGRSAAQAVRQSVREGNLPDALIIVRSLYYARLGPGAIRASEPVRRFLTEIEGSPIPFDRAVSPRLPAHALLHALVRRGEHQNAAKLAQQMLESGTNVRSASMAAVLGGLRDAAANSPPSVLAPISPLTQAGAARMRPHMRGNAELTGAALMLVQAARGARQRSTRRMYRYLITLCIINGEIILGSLVFGVMLRDWQARQQAEIAVPAATSFVDAVAPPPPRLSDMRELLTFINWNLSAPQTDDSSRAAFSASLQALANLAYAMDKRYLALNLESLIAAIYRCPRTKEKVWIPGKNPDSPPVQVVGYQYLHATLDRLIMSLPKEDYDGGPIGSGDYAVKPGEQVVQPLNPWAYNSLLNYALRHRHSLSKAEIVLTRMLQHPDAHLAENMALTHNIMDRARNDWPKTTIDKMEAAVGLEPPGADVISALLDVPDAQIDKHALSTQITTLIRLGQLGDIVAVLPKMLPGLYPPPTPHGTPFEESLKMKARHREGGLARAVALGPVVFCTLLHALRKLGKTGLAEDVFLYGLEAEARSFKPEEVAVIRPWCLPVQAYTAMIQVYNNERSKGRKLYVVGWGLTEDGARIEWSQQRARVRRADLARKMIVLMYHTMMAAPSTITSRLAELDALTAQGRCTVAIARRQLEPPVPDAWFFESLVDIFIARPADRMFPGVLKAMAEHGFEMSAGAGRVLRETWGEETVREVLAARLEGGCVARNMRPVGMSGKTREGGVRVKLGWKQWAMKKVRLSKEEEKMI